MDKASINDWFFKTQHGDLPVILVNYSIAIIITILLFYINNFLLDLYKITLTGISALIVPFFIILFSGIITGLITNYAISLKRTYPGVIFFISFCYGWFVIFILLLLELYVSFVPPTSISLNPLTGTSFYTYNSGILNLDATLTIVIAFYLFLFIWVNIHLLGTKIGVAIRNPMPKDLDLETATFKDILFYYVREIIFYCLLVALFVLFISIILLVGYILLIFLGGHS